MEQLRAECVKRKIDVEGVTLKGHLIEAVLDNEREDREWKEERAWKRERWEREDRILQDRQAHEFRMQDLNPMRETDENVKHWSQCEDPQLKFKQLRDLLGLRGHLQDELLRIEAMLAEGDPELKCLSQFEGDFPHVVLKLREINEKNKHISIREDDIDIHDVVAASSGATAAAAMAERSTQHSRQGHAASMTTQTDSGGHSIATQSNIGGHSMATQSGIVGHSMATQSNIGGHSMATQSGIVGHSMATQSNIGGHSMATQSDIRGHSMATQSDIRGHSMATQSDIRGHSMATQSNIGGHSMATQRDIRGHSMATQSNIGGHSMATQSNIGGHSMATQSGIRGHSMATQSNIGGHSMTTQSYSARQNANTSTKVTEVTGEDLKQKHEIEENYVSANFANKFVNCGDQMTQDDVNNLLDEHALRMQALRKKQKFEKMCDGVSVASVSVGTDDDELAQQEMQDITDPKSKNATFLDNIRKQRNSGQLSDEDFQRLLKKHLDETESLRRSRNAERDGLRKKLQEKIKKRKGENITDVKSKNATFLDKIRKQQTSGQLSGEDFQRLLQKHLDETESLRRSRIAERDRHCEQLQENIKKRKGENAANSDEFDINSEQNEVIEKELTLLEENLQKDLQNRKKDISDEELQALLETYRRDQEARMQAKHDNKACYNEKLQQKLAARRRNREHEKTNENEERVKSSKKLNKLDDEFFQEVQQFQGQDGMSEEAFANMLQGYLNRTHAVERNAKRKQRMDDKEAVLGRVQQDASQVVTEHEKQTKQITDIRQREKDITDQKLRKKLMSNKNKHSTKEDLEDKGFYEVDEENV